MVAGLLVLLTLTEGGNLAAAAALPCISLLLAVVGADFLSEFVGVFVTEIVLGRVFMREAAAA